MRQTSPVTQEGVPGAPRSSLSRSSGGSLPSWGGGGFLGNARSVPELFPKPPSVGLSVCTGAAQPGALGAKSAASLVPGVGLPCPARGEMELEPRLPEQLAQTLGFSSGKFQTCPSRRAPFLIS